MTYANFRIDPQLAALNTHRIKRARTEFWENATLLALELNLSNHIPNKHFRTKPQALMVITRMESYNPSLEEIVSAIEETPLRTLSESEGFWVSANNKLHRIADTLNVDLHSLEY